MIIRNLPSTDYLKFENDTTQRILINICNNNNYGITDSNLFWDQYYTKPKKDYCNLQTKKFGDVFYTSIFSYSIICNMICVDWPKTTYNITPFKIKYFDICCSKCYQYMKNNNINIIYTPVFAKEILEGSWIEILNHMDKHFPNIHFYIFKS